MPQSMRQPPASLRERLAAAARASSTDVGWTKSLVIAAAVGVFLALAGAFGTGGEALGMRLAYWIGLMLAGTLLARFLGIAASRTPGLRGRKLAQIGAITLAMAVIDTFVVWQVSRAFFGAGDAWDLAPLFWSVLLVSAAMSGLHLLAEGRLVETHAAADGAPSPRFLERLPPRLMGAELQAVEAQDHYLRLHTNRGTDLILMRLSDAVAELEGLEGARTHRSWWVAKAAVDRARPADGRAVLVLKSGVEVPVSRSYVGQLKAEGWF